MADKTSTPRTPAPPSPAQPHLHSVQFYEDDGFLIDGLGRFIGGALGAGDAGIVIATEAHRRELCRRLEARGLDVHRAVEQGRLIVADAAETLDRFLVNDWPDEERFVQVIGGMLTRAREAAAGQHGRAALFGEMVALLWEHGRTEAAIRLEQLWNQIAQSHSFSLVCAYPLNKFYLQEHGEPFARICAEHGAVVPAESYTLASDEERSRIVAQWQQKALALEREVARSKELHEAASKLAAIVEFSDDAIASKDLNGIVTSWNPGAERIFGYTAEEMVGRSILTIIPPERQSEEDMILGRLRKGERIDHYESVRMTKDGRRIQVSLTVSPLRDETGKVVGATKIARDITEHRLAEEALRRAERLAATGRLAATIAHEINNPLEAVTNLLYLLRSSVMGEEGRRCLALAESELDRVAQITKQTLGFYRGSSIPEPVSLPELLDLVLGMLAIKIAKKRITLARTEEPCTISAFKGELRQLFINLLDNAVEATPDGGTIRVSVARQDGKAVVVIADNGPGIPAQNRERIFQPFFTTKEVGTGLGLWVAQEIAAKHGGRIVADSSTSPDDHGTTFQITLDPPFQTDATITTAA